MAFDRQSAKKAGYSDQEIDSYLAQKSVKGIQTEKQTSPLEGLLQSKTLPIAGGALGGIIGGLAGGVPGIAGAGAGYFGGDVLRKELGKLLGIQGVQPEQPLQNLGETAQGAGAAAALQGIGSGFSRVAGKIAPYLTKGGLANLTTKAAEESTNAVPFGTIKEQALERVGKKFGPGEILQAAEDWFKTRAPASLSPNELSVSPSDILNTRRQISNFLSSGGPLSFLRPKTTEELAKSEIGSTLSQILHQATPATKTSDWLYSLYSKPYLGDVPQMLTKLGGLGLLSQFGGNPLGKLLGGIARGASGQ